MRQLAAAAIAVLPLLATSTAPAAIGEKAVAEVKTAAGKSLGRIEFTETVAGVLIRIRLQGLPPGPRGFHLHEVGKCEGPAFASAGGVHNPFGARHGFLNEEGPQLGDLPNLIVPASGEVDIELHNALVSIAKDADENLLSGDGTAVLIFEKPDDYKTDPGGNAGAAIACGVLVPAK